MKLERTDKDTNKTELINKHEFDYVISALKSTYNCPKDKVIIRLNQGETLETASSIYKKV